ncbi:MAG: 4Fe-4S binding protein [Alistipes sp.]|nr:4Fe-4S binding protein [Alistipes sp.]
MITVEQIQAVLAKAFRESSHNYVSEQMALVPEDVGERLYDDPIVKIGSADDELWQELKRPEVVGHLFRAPKEWLASARCVVSYFAPFSDFVVEGNGRDAVEVSNGWLYARVEGQAFLTEMNHFLEEWFAEQGIEALSPYASEEFRYVFEAGTNDDIADKSLSFTSNWSERHVAYVCGQGTFGLSKGVITERGVAGRFGSVVVGAPLATTPRPYSDVYEYCTKCGACARQCPGLAISIAEGKSHPKCCSYVNEMRVRYAPRFGCGKCQVRVPCERGIPKK